MRNLIYENEFFAEDRVQNLVERLKKNSKREVQRINSFRIVGATPVGHSPGTPSTPPYSLLTAPPDTRSESPLSAAGLRRLSQP
jgi:hypothetical protein